MNMQDALTRTREIFAKAPESKHPKVLKRIVDDAELVLGVINDPKRAGGWDCLVIKGHLALSDIIRGNSSSRPSFAAIPCKNIEAAVAIKKWCLEGLQ
jgi:hypothetical protein